MEGKLLVISGLSAAGKGTIASKLVEKFDNYVLSISVTTREKRGTEKEGVDYFFRSKDEFKEICTQYNTSYFSNSNCIIYIIKR